MLSHGLPFRPAFGPENSLGHQNHKHDNEKSTHGTQSDEGVLTIICFITCDKPEGTRSTSKMVGADNYKIRFTVFWSFGPLLNIIKK